MLAVVTFGLASSFTLALAAILVVRRLRRTHEPIFTAWVNQRLDPRVRATVRSMAGQTDALGQIAGGPLLGLIGTAFSIPAALTTAGLLLTPAAWLYIRTLRRPDPATR